MKSSLIAALVLAAGIATSAHAVTDPTGDFIHGNVPGASVARLDIVDFSVSQDATSFFLSAEMAADITDDSFFVFGVDRTGGASNHPFAAAPDVTFDTALRITGLAGLGTLLGHPQHFTVTGAKVFGTIAKADLLSLLPVGAVDPSKFRFSLWSVLPGQTGVTGFADFGANDGTIGASVPEPASWALMILGFGAIGASVRRRRAAPALG